MSHVVNQGILEVDGDGVRAFATAILTLSSRNVL